MPNPFTLPMIAAIALGGAGGGLYLGRSAIAEINPAHFAPKFEGSQFYSDLVPGANDYDEPVATAQAQPIAFTGGYGDGCVNCATYPEEYQPRPLPVGGQAYDDGRSPIDALFEDVDRELAEADRAASATIERYAYYRVSGDDPEQVGPVRVHRGNVVEVTSEPPVETAAAVAPQTEIIRVGADTQQ